MQAQQLLRHVRLPERTTSGRRDIQGLRAFAVVVVILNHLAGWPNGGYVGVDMFFVISGFLITGLLLREHERTGHISFTGFYRRRVKRIIPAAVLVLAVTLMGSYFIFNAARFHVTSVDELWALLFAANWRFAALSTNYFSANGPVSPVQHFWSLGVEEQFYLVWPWLMLGIFALLIRRRKSTRSARVVVGLALGVITVASFGWALLETRDVPNLAYFSTFSRTWELGVGALLAVAASALASLPARLRPFLAWVGIAGMVASLWYVDEAGAFPAPAALLPVASAALVIIAGTGVEQQAWLFPLTNRASVYTGNISYSLYLWHFPVIILGAALVGDDTAHRVLFGVVLVAAAVYSYHLVENPIRRSDWLTGRRHGRRGWPEFSTAYRLTALSLLFVITVGLVAISLTPRHPAQGVTFSVPDSTGSSGPNTHTVPPKLHALQQQIVSALAATSWPDNLDPSIDQVLAGQEAPADVLPCGLAGPVDEAKCSWGSPNAPHTAIIAGSSISMTYVAALRAALPAAQWRLTSYGMFGCDFMDIGMYRGSLGDRAGCTTRLNGAVAAIDRIKPDLVFVSGIYTSEAAIAEWRKVTAPSKLVVLPGPPGDTDLHACYTKLSSPSDCVSTVLSDFASGDRDFAQAAGGVFVQSTPWFCYSGECPSFVGTTVTKMDNRHMTPAYAVRIVPVIREDLVRLGVLPKTSG